MKTQTFWVQGGKARGIYKFINVFSMSVLIINMSLMGVFFVAPAAVEATPTAPTCTPSLFWSEGTFDTTPDGYANWTSGNPENGKWEIDNSGHTGKAARIKGNNNDSLFLYDSVNTTGQTNIVFSYWFKSDNLDDGDTVKAEWSSNGGSTWTNLFTIDEWTDESIWTQKTHSLSSGAANNSNFRIRFKADLHSASRKVWLDDVTLSGCPSCVPTTEVCDGVDNDCDQGVDEGLVAPAASDQDGVCFGATQICTGVGGWVNDYSNVPYYQAEETLCDTYDNDCDVTVDEGFDVGASCTVGDGACANTGVLVCAAAFNGTECSVEPNNPGTETCDNDIDDDCDGLTDCNDTSDCANDTACVTTETNCTDGVDNDGDTDVDCADSDCANDDACQPAEPVCGNQIVESGEDCDGSDVGCDTGYTCVRCNCMPEEPTCTEGLVTILNGGFETPVVDAHSGQWQAFPSGTTGLDWAVEWVAPTPGAPDPANLELQTTSLGWTAAEGNQWAELDADYIDPAGGAASVKISQTVTTIPGATYKVSFKFSPRPGQGIDQNVLQVKFGSIDQTISLDGTGNTDTAWSSYDYSMTATNNSALLEFTDLGTPNSYGTLLDDVKVELTDCPGPTTGTITIHKYNDLNGDGNRDEEPFLQGWEVFISGNMFQYDGPIPITNSDGIFTFDNVPFGDYLVCEIMQAGWVNTQPATSTFDWANDPEDPMMVACDNITVSAENDDIDYYFGNVHKDIQGCKYNDVDNDHQIEPGEATLPGWTINLESCYLPQDRLTIATFSDEITAGPEYICTPVATTVTGPDGCYYFTGLDNGTYRVSEVQQSGWTQTYPIDPNYHQINLGMLLTAFVSEVPQLPTYYNFANYQQPPCGNGIIEQNLGEQCDEGGSNGACPANCSSTCQINQCSSGGGPSSGGGGLPPCYSDGTCSTATGYSTTGSTPIVAGEEGAPKLEITKSVNKDFVNPGQTDVEYTIIVKNTGNLTAFDVTVTDNMPAGLVHTDGQAPVYTWNIGDLAPGASKEIKFMAAISKDAKPNTYTNVATAKASNYAEVSANVKTEVKSVAVLAATGFSGLELLWLVLALISLVGASQLLRIQLKK